VKADFPDGNRDWRLRGFNRAVWRRDVLSGDQQGEVVRSIILEAEKLWKFDEREGAEQQSRYDRKAEPAARWTA